MPPGSSESSLQVGFVSSKPLPAIPPPVPPKSPQPKPLPPIPIHLDDSDDDSDDDAPLLPSGPATRNPFIISPGQGPTDRSVYVLYALSLLCSCGSLALLFGGYRISKHAPFSKHWYEHQMSSYRDVGLIQIMILSGIDIVWSCAAIFTALKMSNYFLISNVIYDFALFALPACFAILGIITRMWDRRLCDADGYREGEEYHDACEATSRRLLVLELSGLAFALLVAGNHLVLLVSRCCLDLSFIWRRFRRRRRNRVRLTDRSGPVLDEAETLNPEAFSGNRQRLQPPGNRFGVSFRLSNDEGAIRI